LDASGFIWPVVGLEVKYMYIRAARYGERLRVERETGILQFASPAIRVERVRAALNEAK
jgi:hypothetical protein